MVKFETEVMSLKEVADYLRVHPSTVYRLLKQREIPGFKFGMSDWRFRKSTIDAWLEKQEKEGK